LCENFSTLSLNARHARWIFLQDYEIPSFSPFFADFDVTANYWTESPDFNCHGLLLWCHQGLHLMYKTKNSSWTFRLIWGHGLSWRFSCFI
jgi:hypothetical protein